ncbi:hypothetical protein [Stenotrophomonas virus Jojan60]|jgi:hypothetical protein|nr:hypothetical protein [Stenotrophomonas virus Jojan60]
MSSKDAPIAQQIYMLELQKRQIERQIDTLKAEFRERAIDNYTAGDFLIQVQRNARFDAALAAQVLTEDEFDQVLVTKPDSARAKDVLSPARYRACQKESAPKVIVTLLPDEED